MVDDDCASGETSDLARAQARTGYLFVLPTSLLYLTFVLAPVVLTVILSFAYYDPMLGSRWVGFDNFARFFTNPRSLQIFWNTLRFAFFAVTFNVSVGLLLAVALNRAMPRLAALFLPARLLPAGDHRRRLRLDRVELFLRRRSRRHQLLPARSPASPAVHWLTDSRQRHDVDHHHGRLEEHRLLHGHLHRRAAGRAEEHHRSGADGRDAGLAAASFASPCPTSRRSCSSPSSTPRSAPCRSIESIVILTQGGPGDSTRSLSILIVEEGFGSFQIGYAAAISVVMTVIILIITAIQQLLSRRWVEQ